MANSGKALELAASVWINPVRPDLSSGLTLVPGFPSGEDLRVSDGDPTADGELHLAAPEITPGTVIGRFELLSILGKGGQSVVYLARDPFLDELVAVKQLSIEHSGDPEMRARFIREGRIARSMGADRVVTIHDLGDENDQPYLVMQFHNDTLADRLDQRDRSLDPTDSVEVLVHELHACLQALSRHGIVHRDIKPSNLLIAGRSVDARGGETAVAGPYESLLDAGERLILADFGLARSTDQSKITLGAGTSGYMAPEQMRPGVELDHRADIFSATALVANWMAMSGVQVSDEMKATIARGMAYDRIDRYSNADEWMAAFDAALAADPSALSLRPVLLGMLVAVLLSVLVIGAQVGVTSDMSPVLSPRPVLSSSPVTATQASPLSSGDTSSTMSGAEHVIGVVGSVELESKREGNVDVGRMPSMTSTTAEVSGSLPAEPVPVSAGVAEASESPNEPDDSCVTGQHLIAPGTIDGFFEFTITSERANSRAELTGTDRATDCTDRNQNDE